MENFELVTADSKILKVNDTSHQDLFWALKGGSGDFGIVTRFDVATYPATDVYAGTLDYGAPAVPDFIDALKAIVDPGGGIDDPSSAIFPPNVDIDVSTGTVIATGVHFQQWE